MKIFFASLTDLSIEVDAWVPTVEQGVVLLDALRDRHIHHDVVMRARLRKYQDFEERFIGIGIDAVEFINRVKEMGNETVSSS